MTASLASLQGLSLTSWGKFTSLFFLFQFFLSVAFYSDPLSNKKKHKIKKTNFREDKLLPSTFVFLFLWSNINTVRDLSEWNISDWAGPWACSSSCMKGYSPIVGGLRRRARIKAEAGGKEPVLPELLEGYRDTRWFAGSPALPFIWTAGPVPVGTAVEHRISHQTSTDTQTPMSYFSAWCFPSRTEMCCPSVPIKTTNYFDFDTCFWKISVSFVKHCGFNKSGNDSELIGIRREEENFSLLYKTLEPVLAPWH